MTGKEALIILSKCCSSLAFEEGKWKISERDNEALQTLKEIVVKYDKYKRAFDILKDKFNLRVFPLLIVDEEIKSMCLTYNGDYRRTIELNDEEAELLEEVLGNENT